MTRPKIDGDLVLHVAKLASLSLSDSEVNRFAAELGRIVAHVEQLDVLDTRDVPATAHLQIDRGAWREDEVQPGLSREKRRLRTFLDFHPPLRLLVYYVYGGKND